MQALALHPPLTMATSRYVETQRCHCIRQRDTTHAYFPQYCAAYGSAAGGGAGCAAASLGRQCWCGSCHHASQDRAFHCQCPSGGPCTGTAGHARGSIGCHGSCVHSSSSNVCGSTWSGEFCKVHCTRHTFTPCRLAHTDGSCSKVCTVRRHTRHERYHSIHFSWSGTLE